jgi:hypothetical protein
MKCWFNLICVFVFIVAFSSCGITKGYVGAKLPDSELSIIRGESNRANINAFKKREKVLLAKVDTLKVGDYYGGWPKYIKVQPGKRVIEVRHFKEWDINKGFNSGGLVGGYMSGNDLEKKGVHFHYILTFDVEKANEYSIYIKSDKINIDEPVISIINKSNGNKIPCEIIEKIYNQK